MHIICNGQQREIKGETTLSSLLDSLQLRPEAVVAEVNKNIIDPDQYDTLLLQDGDTVELIRFVGGG
ncbi:sulfur carrier protein ThiS [Desulfolithobacter sp.]